MWDLGEHKLTSLIYDVGIDLADAFSPYPSERKVRNCIHLRQTTVCISGIAPELRLFVILKRIWTLWILQSITLVVIW